MNAESPSSPRPRVVFAAAAKRGFLFACRFSLPRVCCCLVPVSPCHFFFFFPIVMRRGECALFVALGVFGCLFPLFRPPRPFGRPRPCVGCQVKKSFFFSSLSCRAGESYDLQQHQILLLFLPFSLSLLQFWKSGSLSSFFF